MKRMLVVVIAFLLVTAVAGLSFAVEEKKAAPKAEKKELSAEKSVEVKAPSKVKQVKGNVLAVDAKANTLTVKGKKNKGDLVLTVNASTIIKLGKENRTLADLKVGDKITATYSEAEGKNIVKGLAIFTDKTLPRKALAKLKNNKTDGTKETAPAAKPEEKK